MDVAALVPVLAKPSPRVKIADFLGLLPATCRSLAQAPAAVHTRPRQGVASRLQRVVCRLWLAIHHMRMPASVPPLAPSRPREELAHLARRRRNLYGPIHRVEIPTSISEFAPAAGEEPAHELPIVWRHAVPLGGDAIVDVPAEISKLAPSRLCEELANLAGRRWGTRRRRPIQTRRRRSRVETTWRTTWRRRYTRCFCCSDCCGADNKFSLRGWLLRRGHQLAACGCMQVLALVSVLAPAGFREELANFA
mmetsp:Transcript_106602/g.299516  ORF Transcript_106602/g.299516 Transcript_106602/m.299516 type:complete len:251 (+) Transcript_106602:154-906(+)